MENLSRCKTQPDGVAADFDFAKVVVNKPWGYEYLWYESPTVAIWLLFLKENAATSLHCHLRKRTSLILLEGKLTCATLEDRVRLTMLDSVVLEAGVFHSSQATSPGGAFLIEIENTSDECVIWSACVIRSAVPEPVTKALRNSPLISNAMNTALSASRMDMLKCAFARLLSICGRWPTVRRQSCSLRVTICSSLSPAVSEMRRAVTWKSVRQHLPIG